MPRTARASLGGYCYHVLNRANGRRAVFRKDADYPAFLKLLREAGKRTPIRLLSYCPMLNQFHLVVWPKKDGDLSTFMQWLMTAHVRRYHQYYKTSGHVWQGRFKAFPVQEDEQPLTVLRYTERNPVRANLAERAQDWRWSSAADPQPVAVELYPGSVRRPANWLKWVNQPQTEAEMERLRQSILRGRPFGTAPWTVNTARELGLEASLRPRGRPRKGDDDSPLFRGPASEK